MVLRFRRLLHGLNPFTRRAEFEARTHRRLGQIEERQREILLLLSKLSLPPAEAWSGLPPLIAGGPGANVFPYSTLCRQDSFHHPSFSHWTRTLGQGLRYHRKLWEFVFICQALWERGAIREGARGLFRLAGLSDCRNGRRSRGGRKIRLDSGCAACSRRSRPSPSSPMPG